jgi:DNA-directed RNA polymerase specialized sigma24 family protein
VTESAAKSAEREAARRQVVTELRVAASTASYAAGQVADGLSPSEATRAALDAADAMEATARTLRALLARPRLPAERRALAVQLVAQGLTQRQAAARLGVSPRRVWDYLAGR